MVYLVYSDDTKFNGVYDDEDEANQICNMNGNLWKVISLPYFKKEPSTFHYSEEDPEYDETHIIELKQKNDDLEQLLKTEKKKFKILEEFTNFFLLLIMITVIYAYGLLIMLIHKY